MTLRGNCRCARPPVLATGRHARDTEPGSVRTAAQRTFPSREGRHGRPAEGERLLQFEAIAADPGYALAYADLSDIYRSLANSGLLDPKVYLPKAREAAQKALELDEGLAEGHYVLANLMSYSWEWADAEREYKRAIELNPNLALAHRLYATYLRLMGRHEQAISAITRARELDPLSPGVNATVGYVLASARRYDQAIAALNKTIELDANYPYTYLFLGQTYTAQGKHAEAVAAFTRAIALGLDTHATQVYLGAAARGRATARARWRSFSACDRARSAVTRPNWRSC